ncbi:MAG: hypothetical protein JXQ75_13295, partial [Phycisphaerae bacterium]|nr:hypothetical protein [Phycisphaerae bacterium]
MNAESAEPKPTDAQERAKQLAKLTARAYREATQLSYRADITSGNPPEHIWCTARHRPRHELDLRVYDDTGLIYELHKHPDGAIVKIRERNYVGDQREEYEVAIGDLEGPTRKWRVRCRTGLNVCMFGSNTMSWLGPDAKHSAFLEEVIAISEPIGIREVEGFPCDVLQNHRLKDFVETFYLDCQNHVLRRWTHLWNGVTRDRVFSHIEIVSPPPEARSSSAAPASAPATTQESIEARLARQMAEVLRRAEALSIWEQVAWGEPPVRLRCAVRHGQRHELDLRVYDDTGLIYELHKRPDGAKVKIRERNYVGDQAEQYEVAIEDLEVATRNWDVHCDKGLNACMFGSQTMSWLGRDAKHSAVLQKFIAVSEYVGIREVGGIPCDVLQNHRLKGLTETFYLDRQSHVIRRWTQLRNGVNRRDSIFSKIELTLPENKTGE